MENKPQLEYNASSIPNDDEMFSFLKLIGKLGDSKASVKKN